MARLGFRMKLHPGMEAEYRRRHDAIWPELSSLLSATGIRHYSIFLDPETLHLFGVLEMDDPNMLDKLAEQPLMKKWWTYMKDIMETQDNHAPVSIPLKEVFYLE